MPTKRRNASSASATKCAFHWSACPAAATGEKLTSSKIAAKLGLKTAQFLDRATENGFLALDGDRHVLTAKGEKAGAEFVAKSRFGPYFLWPQDFHPV